ncbi:MAG: PAS domain S-box protein [Syntrophobacter sp.]
MSGLRIPPPWSISRKLILFILILFLPACVITVSSSFKQRNNAIREAENKVLLLVKSMAAQQEQAAIGSRQLLSALAFLPMVRDLDASACNNLFRDLINRNPCYSTIAAATPDGKLFAASTPLTPESIDLSDQTHIKDAIRTLDFSAGVSDAGKVSDAPSLNYAHPVLDANGKLIAVIVADSKLNEYARFPGKMDLPERCSMTILDYRGSRLYRLPGDDVAASGMRDAPETPRLVSGDLDHGTLERTGADGINRICAFQRLRLGANSAPYLYLIIGIPKDEILQTANLHIFGSLSVLGIALCTMLLMAGNVDRERTKVELRSAEEESGSGVAAQGIVVGAIETLEDVTARKEAEDVLISANRQLNDIIEFLPDATLVIDMDMKVIAWNRAIEDMTGVSRKEVIGKRRDTFTAPFLCEKRLYLFDLIDVRDEELESRYQHIVRKGDILCAQTYVPYLNRGNGAYVFATAAPLFDANGNRLGAIEIIRDITEQVHAQEALRIGEEKYRELVENANSIILRMDNLGNVTFINEFAQRFFGYSEDEILGRNVVGTIVPPIETGGRDLRLMIENIAMNPDRYASNVNENVRRGGERVWIAWTFKPIRYEEGQVVEVLCVGNDITERKVMEEAIVEAEARYRSIFENALMGIFQSTPRGRLLKLNRAFARILGYDSPEDVLKEVSDISRQHYVNPAHRTELLQQIEERELVQDFEAQIYRKDRSVAWITLSTRAVRDMDGEIIHLEGTVQDITDSKLMESQLNQARKMEAIGTLAGGIAHDFNNILTPILGYSEISLNDAPKGSQLYYNLEQIFLSGSRARELVKQILTFSRKGEQAPRPVQVSLLIKETLKLLRSSLPSTIEIRQELDKDATDNTVMADPIQIHQVLMNLCTNAAHAMREKGGVLTIALRNEDIESGARTGIADLEPGAYLRLSVVDTGHGMDEATKERIFEPYFTTKGPSEGTGLGLALVYGITRSLSGGIAVRSKPGQGATFDVYFPRTKSIQAPTVAASVHLPTGKGHILVVDDEKPIVDMLKAMLQRLGYDITERYSSHDALQTFGAQPESFDLVISDLTMPHMTGIDLAKEILRIRADTPIILCTGFSESIDENRVRFLGLRGFLMKPVAMQDLATAVNKILVGDKALK